MLLFGHGVVPCHHNSTRPTATTEAFRPPPPTGTTYSHNNSTLPRTTATAHCFLPQCQHINSSNDSNTHKTNSISQRLGLGPRQRPEARGSAAFHEG